MPVNWWSNVQGAFLLRALKLERHEATTEKGLVYLLKRAAHAEVAIIGGHILLLRIAMVFLSYSTVLATSQMWIPPHNRSSLIILTAALARELANQTSVGNRSTNSRAKVKARHWQTDTHTDLDCRGPVHGTLPLSFLPPCSMELFTCSTQVVFQPCLFSSHACMLN